MAQVIDGVQRWYRRRSLHAAGTGSERERRTLPCHHQVAWYREGRIERCSRCGAERESCPHEWQRLWGAQVWTCSVCGARKDELVF
jgi:hypothetical protein